MTDKQTWESVTKRFTIGAEKGYLTVCLVDGKPNRILLDVAKEGTTTGGFARQWAQTFSRALKSGATLEQLIADSRGVSFDPDGWSDLGFARSIVDYVAKYLHERFVVSTPQTEESEKK